MGRILNWFKSLFVNTTDDDKARAKHDEILRNYYRMAISGGIRKNVQFYFASTHNTLFDGLIMDVIDIPDCDDSNFIERITKDPEFTKEVIELMLYGTLYGFNVDHVWYSSKNPIELHRMKNNTGKALVTVYMLFGRTRTMTDDEKKRATLQAFEKLDSNRILLSKLVCNPTEEFGPYYDRYVVTKKLSKDIVTIADRSKNNKHVDQ